METNSVIHMVGAQCSPEVEEKLNKWLIKVHIPMLFRFEGLRRVTQYQIMKRDEMYPNILTLFEFDNQQAFEAFEVSPELAEARKDSSETPPEGASKSKIKWRVQYRALKTWEKQVVGQP